MKLKKYVAGVLSLAMVLPLFGNFVKADDILDDVFEDYDLIYLLEHDKRYNTDGRSGLSATEINNITTLTIDGTYKDTVTSLVGIEHLPNLKNLIFRDATALETIDLRGCTNIESVSIYGSSVSKLVLGNHPSLHEIDISSTQISAVDTTCCPTLYYLNTAGSRVTSVYIGDNPLLLNAYNLSTPTTGAYPAYQYLYMSLIVNSGTNIVSSEPSGWVALNSTKFPNEQFREYLVDAFDNGDGILNTNELSNTKDIEYYYGGSMQGISNLTNLQKLYIGNVQNTERISSVDVTHNTKLKELSIDGTNISSVNLSNCPDLYYFSAIGTRITSLDIRNNPYLSEAYNTTDEPVIDNEANAKYYSYIDPQLQVTVFLIVPSNCNVTSGAGIVPVDTGNGSGNSDDSGVAGFVERLYTIALGRASDPNGKADWVNRVYYEGATGADIARGFLFSPEFLGKAMSDGDFLDVLYRVFFDRAADSAGKNDWLNRMANGMDKQTVIWGFINSTEWANVCCYYGIESGGSGVPNITIEPSDEIIAFATRLYTTCLGRPADQNGLMDWATKLANRQISGSEAAAGFFTSVEFVNAGYDNAEYINRLYQTFMGRPADQGGFDYWMGQMSNGASRADVFNGFAGSQEWAGICYDYGILK